MINLSENSTLEDFQALPYWYEEERVTFVEPAGESNMNLVLRIHTSERTVILKQSKPYVRKYPHIPAPIERIEVEAAFLSLLSKDGELAKMTPNILHIDFQNHLFLSSDLGKGSDFSEIYSNSSILKKSDLIELMSFLTRLHELKPEYFPDNHEMRKLNHEHLFHFPFMEENDFNLDTIQNGLQTLSMKYKTDSKLKAELKKLGERYLSEGNTLIHGDFYPGSWLKVADGVKVIDPEFGFMGDREFDLGILMAHLDLSLVDEDQVLHMIKSYRHTFDLHLANQYRGMEIQRRLIGIAQLPLKLSLTQKAMLLEKAKNLILFS